VNDLPKGQRRIDREWIIARFDGNTLAERTIRAMMTPELYETKEGLLAASLVALFNADDLTDAQRMKIGARDLVGCSGCIGYQGLRRGYHGGHSCVYGVDPECRGCSPCPRCGGSGAEP